MVIDRRVETPPGRTWQRAVLMAKAQLGARGRDGYTVVALRKDLAQLKVRRTARRTQGDTRLAAQASVQRLMMLTGAGEVPCVHVSVEPAVANLGGSRPERFAAPWQAVSAPYPAGATALLGGPA